MTDTFDRFTRALERRRRGAVDLTARVTADGLDAASFSGSYVAMRLEDDEAS